MNTLRNRVQLIGRVGRNPEILNLEDGRKLAKFSMATNDFYTNGNGDKMAITDWHQVSFWNKTAEVVEKYVFQGNEIAVEGKLSSHSWEDMDGIKHYQTGVIGVNLIFLGKKIKAPQKTPGRKSAKKTEILVE